MRKPLLIYGAGGLGREVLSLVRALEEWEPAGFIDDVVKKGSTLKGLPVLGGSDMLATFEGSVSLIIAIGDPAMKAEVVKKLAFTRVHYPVIIHPSAILQHKASITLSEGCIIGAGTIVTTDVDIGAHVLINLNVTIGHDTHVGDYSSIMPGVNIAGEVKIGESVLLGSGANIMNRVTIGNKSKVGMGAVVIHDVAPGITVVGVPARPVG